MMRMRVFKVDPEIYLRISNRAAGQNITPQDLMRSFIDSYSKSGIQTPGPVTTLDMVWVSCNLSPEQDAALDKLIDESNTKGQAFRAALNHGIGVPNDSG